MKEKLASAWIVPSTITGIIASELLVWMVFGPLAALIVAIVASQIGAAVLVLWLSQRQRRHSAQIERNIEQHAVGLRQAVRALEKRVESNRRNLAEMETRMSIAAEEDQEILNLNTTEIRRLSQLPTNLKPHPTELRVLDELIELRTGVNVLHDQLSNLKYADQGSRE